MFLLLFVATFGVEFGRCKVRSSLALFKGVKEELPFVTFDSFVALFLNDMVNVKLYAGDNTAIYGGSPTQGSSWITLTANTNYFVEI